jgi:hypothetical protein
MSAPERIRFTVESDGKSYACERVVTGVRVLRQQIQVLGIGSKADPATYGARGHPSSSMASTARLIARDIIGAQESKKRTS